ncbi:hypothetical protein [Acetivibrio ethanolgignens]|uniref:Uncharacterized protein n=1 Tax=Acetivibrio ethanolgignens TaxID=290052 RepID=A0A0V8QH24_9FIRM|nr:hypothetical protein [Acetivibrio ethanolgignens]KSV59873.1 hypothetical protein ASU35_07675 [Acetivibrio ethanolgignens]
MDVLEQNGYWYYPTYTRLVYNVQGEKTTLQINSQGETDSQQRMDTVTVKDKWNTGEKTTCSYLFGKAKRSIQPTALLAEER